MVFQTGAYVSCSGNRVGSAAAAKASLISIPEAVWCPCPPVPSAANRVMITSGRNFRITQTMSPRTLSFPQNCEGFLGRLGIAEIDRPGEILFGPVDAAGGQEFLGPQEAEFRPLFRTDQVLAALAAGDREIGRPVFPALRERGQERRCSRRRDGPRRRGRSPGR